ncbi:uncharacterized protein [Bemisia tabaci]|uniref:uncharacterized protein isoform X2 n=1 Tax=Bemisia tabaci TaxID=7038 RepID=UPI003B28218D
MSKVIYSTAIFVLALAEASVTSDFDQALAEFRKLKEAGASQLRVLMENTDLRKCNTTDNFLSLLNEGYSIYGKLQASFDAGQQIFNSTHGEPTPQQVKEVRKTRMLSSYFTISRFLIFSRVAKCSENIEIGSNSVPAEQLVW